MHKLTSFLSGQKRKLTAFTLQEILLAMGVVGVISVLLITGLKISDNAKYPTMRAVFKNDIATQLATMNTETNIANFASTDAFMTEFKKYYDVSQTPKAGEEIFGQNYKDASGKQVRIKNFEKQFITKNGTSVALSYVRQDGTIDKFMTKANVDFTNNSFEVSNAALNYVTGVFDVNGSKGPNKIGVDMGIIMPAYPLKKNQYFTFDNEGNIVVKTMTDGGTSASTATTVVDKDGKFIGDKTKTEEAENRIKGCKNSSVSVNNYTLDEYGDCLCKINKAYCANDGGKSFNARSCTCEFNTSCPKNKILNSKGECVCRRTITQCRPYAQKDSAGNFIIADCACKCDLGASLKCINNGGQWDATTCSCNCNSDEVKNNATTRCTNEGKMENGSSYFEPDPENYCGCKCKSEKDVNALIKKLENADPAFKNGAIATTEIENRCFKCKQSTSNNINLVADPKKGGCSAKCSDNAQKDLDKITAWVKQNGQNPFYETPTKNISNENSNSCSKKCRADLDSYCKSLKTGQNINYCPTLTNVFHDQKCSTTKNSFKYSCTTANIKFKADPKTCTCVIDYDGDMGNGYTLLNKNTTYGYAYHGKCGHARAWSCSYQKTTKSLALDPNAKNPLVDTKTKVYYTLVKETCRDWWDPIVLIFNDKDKVSVLSTPSVFVKATNEDVAELSTWIAGSSSKEEYGFLVKLDTINQLGMKEKLFTDLTYETGFEELRLTYDNDPDDFGVITNNGSGVINELDRNYKNLGVWFDRNVNAKYDHGIDKKYSLSELNITDIVVSGLSHRIDPITKAPVSDPGSIQSIYSTYYRGEQIKSTDIKPDEYWLRRAEAYPYQAHKGLYTWVYETVDQEGNKITVYYVFNPVDQKYTFFKGQMERTTGEIVYYPNGDAVPSAYNVHKQDKNKVHRYYVKTVNNLQTYFEHKSFENKILDVLFEGADKEDPSAK